MYTKTTFDISNWYSNNNFKRFFTNYNDSKDNSVNLIQDLAFRRVTVPTDEPICIATLLGVDLDSFKGNPSMIDIYRSLHELLQHLLFVPSPRLDVSGFRWATSTFMTGYDLHCHRPQPAATLDDKSLCVRTDCIFLDETLRSTLDPRSSARIGVECSGDDNFLLSSPWVGHVNAPEYFANVAILLPETLSDSGSATVAVLVSGFRELDSINRCRYVKRLFMYRASRFNVEETARWEEVYPKYLFSSKGKYVEQVSVCVS